MKIDTYTFEDKLAENNNIISKNIIIDNCNIKLNFMLDSDKDILNIIQNILINSYSEKIALNKD